MGYVRLRQPLREGGTAVPDGASAADACTAAAPSLLIWPGHLAASVIGIGGVSAGALVSAGQWHVVTLTSTYVVDLDRAVVTRFPGTHSTDRALTAILRRDGEELPLEGIVAMVGERGVLVLRLAGSGIKTLRETTTVMAIEPAPVVPASVEGILATGTTDERDHTCGQPPDDHDEAQDGGETA